METQEQESALGPPTPAQSPGRQAAERAANAEDVTRVEEGRKITEPDIDDETAEDATTWLLASFREELPRPKHTLKLNVGSISQPKFVKWRVQALPVEMIDKIREDSMPATNRQMRRGGLAALGDPKAQYRGNLKLIAAATIDPDVKAVCASTGLKGEIEFLEDVFRYNSGLVDLIASAILTLSGYDEDNVQDAVEAQATGN